MKAQNNCGRGMDQIPVNYMNVPLNEIVNDTLGGAHIAPTW